MFRAAGNGFFPLFDMEFLTIFPKTLLEPALGNVAWDWLDDINFKFFIGGGFIMTALFKTGIFSGKEMIEDDGWCLAVDFRGISCSITFVYSSVGTRSGNERLVYRS